MSDSSSQAAPAPSARAVWLAVIVAALGYLVDIYDLILFAVVRVPSLHDIGVTDAAAVKTVGGQLISWQMWGMLVGGILWGILGDRRGRLSVLFGSIVMYSLANIANGFVQTVPQYAALRFVAGVGLAGELGAGITLVSEIIDKNKRGWATAFIAGVGICGAVLASLIGDLLPWRVAYFVGGGLGLGLLVLRIGVVESGMFSKVKAQTTVSRGNFFALFSTRRRALRYLCVVLCGIPIWYAIGILVLFSKEIGAAMGLVGEIKPGWAVLWSYSGLAIGDFSAGALSQLMRSRKRALWVFVVMACVTVTLYFVLGRISVQMLYVACGLVGIAHGYWAVFVTVASEQFGTNLRATATTTAPNFVRGSVPLLVAGFGFFTPTFGVAGAAAVVGAIVLAVALAAIFGLEETFGKDLDYVE